MSCQILQFFLKVEPDTILANSTKIEDRISNHYTKNHRNNVHETTLPYYTNSNWRDVLAIAFLKLQYVSDRNSVGKLL